MRYVAITLLLGVFFISCKVISKQTNIIFTTENGILIENSTIITTNSAEMVEKIQGYILTDNEKIVYVGVDKPTVKGNYKILDGAGKFTIPGLIDSHVHLANIAGMSWHHQEDHGQLAKEYYTQLPKSFLYYGYTTLIDVNNYAADIVKGILNSPVKPDIYTCGKQVQVMNDFMMEMGGQSYTDRWKFPFLYDKYNYNLSIPDSINLNPHTPKSIISNISREQHGICIKTLYEDKSSGFPVSWELPTPKIMHDIVQEAHQEGIPVIMHSPSYNGQKFAFESGVDIIAHAMWNWYENPEQFLELTFTDDHKDLLRHISNKKIGYQPTFRAIYGEVDLLHGFFSDDPELENIYPKPYLQWLKSDEGNWGKEKILQRAKLIRVINPNLYNIISSKFNSEEEMFIGIQEVLKDRLDKVVKFLFDHNANLLFATDHGAMNMATHPPGYNGYLEMQHWIKAGVSLEKLFLSATYYNAKSFNIDNQYGSICSGKIANLLLLDKNPLEDISAYNEISHVIVRGKDFVRNMLSAKNK